MNDTADAIERAAHAIREAGSLVITAGAGMSVDSGLPDFRGDEGFWKGNLLIFQRLIRCSPIGVLFLD